MTLEYIYNDLLKEELSLSKNYGITTRMKGLLDAAADQLRVLGGWSEISTMPMLHMANDLSKLLLAVATQIA